MKEQEASGSVRLNGLFWERLFFEGFINFLFLQHVNRNV